MVEDDTKYPAEDELRHATLSASCDLQTLQSGDTRALRKRLMITLILAAAALQTPQIMLMASETRVFEMIYCKQYYVHNDPSKIRTDGVVPEFFCKVQPVQTAVSTLRGWQQFFQSVPAIFVAIPYGMLADRFGRKWLLSLNAASLTLRSIWAFVVCYFPELFDLRMIWLESIFVIAGGGPLVGSSMMYLMISDVTPDAKKAGAFSRLSAASYAFLLTGQILCGFFMKLDARIAFGLAVILQLPAYPISLCIPETLGHLKHQGNDPESSPLLGESSIHSDQPKPLRNAFADMASNVSDMFQNWRVVLLIACPPLFVVQIPLFFQLLQYIPQRYNAAISTAVFLQFFQLLTSTLSLLFALPWLSKRLMGKSNDSQSSRRKDIWLIRIAFCTVVTGWFISGAAPHILVAMLGLVISATAVISGPAIRAVLTSCVDTDKRAQLYSVMGIVECLGLTLSAPAVAALYNAGLGMHKELCLGLPWLVSATVMVAVAVVFWRAF